MRHFYFGFLFVGVLLTASGAIVTADDAKDEAIKKDRKLIEGAWTFAAYEDHPRSRQEKKDFTSRSVVVIDSDGSYTINYSYTDPFRTQGTGTFKGTSTIDPTKMPKTVDLTFNESKGKWLGIYELGEKDWKVCFCLSGRERPTEFSTTPDYGRLLMTFERDVYYAIEIDRKQLEGIWSLVSLKNWTFANFDLVLEK